MCMCVCTLKCIYREKHISTYMYTYVSTRINIRIDTGPRAKKVRIKEFARSQNEIENLLAKIRGEGVQFPGGAQMEL